MEFFPQNSTFSIPYYTELNSQDKFFSLVFSEFVGGMGIMGVLALTKTRSSLVRLIGYAGQFSDSYLERLG